MSVGAKDRYSKQPSAACYSLEIEILSLSHFVPKKEKANLPRAHFSICIKFRSGLTFCASCKIVKAKVKLIGGHDSRWLLLKPA